MSTEQQCPYGCPPGKHEDPAWLCYAERPDASTDSVVVAAIGARQERDRIERRLTAHEEHASEKIYQSRVREAETEIVRLRTNLQIAEVTLNTTKAELEHRIVVLEGQMEQVRAQIEGLNLGMVTFSLDDPSREKLKALLRGRSQPRCPQCGVTEGRIHGSHAPRDQRQGGSDDPIVPDEEGTSRR